jgi:NADH-quinone oxidoreductase subunit C
MAGTEKLERLRERLVAEERAAEFAHGLLAVRLPREDLLAMATRLRDEFGFDMFLDVTAVDWPEREPRFEVVYHFYSTRDHVRVRLKTTVSEEDPVVDSLVSLFGSAGFMERECHEMYGIKFHGNPDLRPLLLYEGFEGHPLRKDYPKEREQPLVRYRT